MGAWDDEHRKLYVAGEILWNGLIWHRRRRRDQSSTAHQALRFPHRAVKLFYRAA